MSTPITGTLLINGVSVPFTGIASMPSVAPVPLPPPPVATLSVNVLGKNFIDQNGAVLRLKIANCSGLEGYAIQNQPWMNQDPWGGRAPNFAVIKAWGFNAVRIPLNQASWLGQTVVDYPSGALRQADPWKNYQPTVKTAVDSATAAGLYVILDLHFNAPSNYGANSQNSMADADHSVAFWTSVATAFKSHPNVVFDLFNEPHIDSFVGIVGVTDGLSAAAWKILRDGGTCTAFQAYSGGTPGGANATVSQNWPTAGMQALLNAVRATGATNVCMAAGLSWALNIAQWVPFAPVDPLKQLACSWHGYAAALDNTKPAYPTSFTDIATVLAAGYPVVCGETGDFTAANAATWLPVLLPELDALGVSVGFWTWDAWGQTQFNLITDAAGTPTPGEGAIVKAWLVK